MPGGGYLNAARGRQHRPPPRSKRVEVEESHGSQSGEEDKVPIVRDEEHSYGGGTGGDTSWRRRGEAVNSPVVQPAGPVEAVPEVNLKAKGMTLANQIEVRSRVWAGGEKAYLPR